MWPFSRGPKPPHPEAAKAKTLAAAYPLGTCITYLGYPMEVVGHMQWDWDDSNWWAALKLEYIVGRKVCEWTLSYQHAMARKLGLGLET